MSLRLDFLPQVRDDLDETYAWYEGRQPGLGEEYLATVRVALDRIRANPDQHPVVLDDVRRAFVRRFKTLILYRPQRDCILIIAVVDGRRDPERWRSRIGT